MADKDLFGEEIKTEYDKFVDKFKPKLTTDDCYTPQKIYEWVKSYVVEQCSISDTTRIMRPFRPNGDYQAEDYSGDCVVIDNPPFSIITKIVRWYVANNIKFFLFAPHLTLFNTARDVPTTKVVASADVTYTNGAQVKTSFISNMFGDMAVIADPAYRREIKLIQDRDKVKLPKYQYPDNVITVSRLSKIVERGGAFSLSQAEVASITKLESQGAEKKSIFGSGYLIGDTRAEELRAKVEVLKWSISAKEREIINRLSV